LRGIKDTICGDIRDSIENGVVTRRVKADTNKTLSGGWMNANGTCYIGVIAKGKNLTSEYTLTGVKCNLLQTIHPNNQYTSNGSYISYNASNGNVQISVKDITTRSDLQAWLNSVDIEYIYPCEPTTEELDTDSKIALNSLETFNGATSISFDSVVQPTFEVEYGESKVGAYTLKALVETDTVNLLALCFPDYANSMDLVKFFSIDTPTKSCIVPSDGFIQFVGGTENDVPNELGYALKINGQTIYETNIPTNGYYCDVVSHLFPVRKNDIVTVTQTTYEWNIVRFYPMHTR
jgi:hypothetical protein